MVLIGGEPCLPDAFAGAAASTMSALVPTAAAVLTAWVNFIPSPSTEMLEFCSAAPFRMRRNSGALNL
jgi:hypothetical protein